jgi:L-Lysine epsilon oxidase N-terminal/L-lysine epsilon oxidase C-terminal domain
VATYRIHPGIGIARLGNSDTDFYLAPETPAGLPQACDANGNPAVQADGMTPVLVTDFKDAQGRIKRQAARFQVFVYDEKSPEGRVLKIGDQIEGGGNAGTLIDIQWQVYVANKKACWYEFQETAGEHGYGGDHPLRNAGVDDRNRLIIDPGPRIVDGKDKRRASFDRSGEGNYATTFPPEGLTPGAIDTLGEIMTDDSARLLVLGGFGRSGSENSGPGEPHISTYANNDGWYDDTSDGPVMARLVMYADNVTSNRYIDVEYPAWVIVGYPRYVPQVLDMVTMDEVLYDLFLRQFATDTSLYGRLGSFANPDKIDFRNEGELQQWRDSGRLTWNTDFKPLFYRDIWPILYRPDQFRFLCDALAQSNYPHDQEQRGLFDPTKLGVAPGSAEAKRVAKQQASGKYGSIDRKIEFANLSRLSDDDEPDDGPTDPYGPLRQYLFGLLRLPGEENEFKIEDRISSRLHNLPLMPLLCGDNPLSNTAPAKFLRLTDYMLFVLKQWADGNFINEIDEGWLKSPPYTPYLPYPTTPPNTGPELDRGVMSNVLGGAFCPGGEAAWIIRNPAIYWAPYRIKADRSVSDFLQSAAQVNQSHSVRHDFTFNVEDPLNQDSDFVTGLQPGDVTKYSALPWQSDFNECTTNDNDVTYANWNVTYPDSENDDVLRKQSKIWTTMWWPAHRPLQYGSLLSQDIKDPDNTQVVQWMNWSGGIQQTSQGDLKMVTGWADLRFIIRNPYLTDKLTHAAAAGPPPYIYLSIEQYKP